MPDVPDVPNLTDAECVSLLQWALPLLGLRWKGFKNVRRQVVRRIVARARELGVDARGYRERLEQDEAERSVLDTLCFVTISRFYRDRSIYDALQTKLLPGFLASTTDEVIRVWSAGCASGEEPYTLSMLWQFAIAPKFPRLALEILATDSNEAVLERAARGVYESTSLHELPDDWRERAFEPVSSDVFRVRDEFRKAITFEKADIRTFVPSSSSLHLVLCRNLAFTYFDEATRIAFTERVVSKLVAGGFVIAGGHETVPEIEGLVHPSSWLAIKR